MIKIRKNGEGFDLADEYIGKVLLGNELRREGKCQDSRLTRLDVKELGPAGAMGVFSLAAFGEDADREGYNHSSDLRGYDSEYLSAEDGGLIANLYGKVLVGLMDFEDGAVDRKGAIRFSCQAELGMGKKVNTARNHKPPVVALNTVTPTYTGRRIYIRPK